MLLSGNYAVAGSDRVRSLIRLNRLGETALLNISTRVRVETGDNALIGGFIITGNEPKKVIVRAIGPSLGIPGALANPSLQLVSDGGPIATNNDWRDSQASDIEATGIPPSNDLESAIIATLAPGAYTGVVRGLDDTVGAGLLEVYDLSRAADAELANISTRGFVQTGDDVMIGGFILGNSANSARIVVRALGPSLGESGVSGTLDDPTLRIVNASGVTVAENDSWSETQRAELEEIGLAPTEAAEAALVTSLAAGNYTAVVRGKNDTTGVALVEIYNLN